MTPSRTSASNQRGIALLLTLLVVTLLTIVVIEFTYSTEVEAHLTRNALSMVQARYLARAGVALAEVTLRLDEQEKARKERPNAETLGDRWAQPFPPQPVGEGVGGAGFVIEDLLSRFNVNALALAPGKNPALLESRKLLFQAILGALGLDVNLLFPLLDWLDSDDEVSTKSGAEKDYYLGLAPAYLPRNGKLLRVEELMLVKGFSNLTREQWAALRSMLTVLPNDDLKINVNTAPELLLVAILTSVDAAAAAKAIVSQRDQHPLVNPTELQQVPGWNQLPKEMQGIFQSRSDHFTIHAVGIAGDVTRALAVTERRSSQHLDVLEWREEAGTGSLTSPAPSVGMTSFRP